MVFLNDRLPTAGEGEWQQTVAWHLAGSFPLLFSLPGTGPTAYQAARPAEQGESPLVRWSAFPPVLVLFVR